jgi:hypothetical protein
VFSGIESLQIMVAAIVGATFWWFRAERASRAEWKPHAPMSVRIAAWFAFAKALRAALEFGAGTLRTAQHLARFGDAHAVLPYLTIRIALSAIAAALLFVAGSAMLSRAAHAFAASLAAGLVVLLEIALPIAGLAIGALHAGARLESRSGGGFGTVVVLLEAGLIVAGGVVVSRRQRTS